MVFSGWFALTFGISHKSESQSSTTRCQSPCSSSHDSNAPASHLSEGFLPSGLPDSSPFFSPLKWRLPGYFAGILIGSRLNVYVSGSPLENQRIVSYRPDSRLLACRPCPKCQMMRLRSLKPASLKML